MIGQVHLLVLNILENFICSLINQNSCTSHILSVSCTTEIEPHNAH